MPLADENVPLPALRPPFQFAVADLFMAVSCLVRRRNLTIYSAPARQPSVSIAASSAARIPREAVIARPGRLRPGGAAGSRSRRRAGAARADPIAGRAAAAPRRRCRGRDVVHAPHAALPHSLLRRGALARRPRRAHRRARLPAHTHYLNWLPSGRIDITLNDITDDANGFASSVPQNFIFAYGAPPASLDELNDFDDFFNLLITHELTHVVHLDTILGPARYINILRGKIYAPNLSQPTWFVEGMAVLHGVAPDHGRAPAQQLLRHGAARAVPRRADARPRPGLERPPRLPAGDGRLPLRLEPAQVRRGPLRPRTRSARSPTATPTPASRAASTERARRPSGAATESSGPACTTTGGARSPTLLAGGRGGELRPLTTATRLTFDAPGPRSEGPNPHFFHDGRVVYHRSNNDQSPAYVRLDPVTGARAADGGHAGGGRPRRRPTAAR